jgi:hypothetical protein
LPISGFYQLPPATGLTSSRPQYTRPLELLFFLPMATRLESRWRWSQSWCMSFDFQKKKKKQLRGLLLCWVVEWELSWSNTGAKSSWPPHDLLINVSDPFYLFLNANERKFIAEKTHSSHMGSLQGAQSTRQRVNYQLISELLGGIKFHLTDLSIRVHISFLLVHTESKEWRIFKCCSGGAEHSFFRVLAHSNLP